MAVLFGIAILLVSLRVFGNDPIAVAALRGRREPVPARIPSSEPYDWVTRVEFTKR